MATLYNTATRQPEAIPEEKLHEALSAGTHAYPVGENISMVDPDGNVGKVASVDIRDAIAAGYRPETARQAAVREYVNENKGITGAAKVALGQFADEALFSIPETIYDATADPLDVAKKEALKKEHSIANALGGVAGFAANTVLGGEMLKAAGFGAEAAGAAGKLAPAAEEAAAAAVAPKAAEAAGAAGRSAPAAVEEAAAVAPKVAEAEADAARQTAMPKVEEAADKSWQDPSTTYDIKGKKIPTPPLEGAAKVAAEKAAEQSKHTAQVYEDTFAYEKAIKERMIASGVPEAEAARVAPSLVEKVMTSAASNGVQMGILAAPKAITEAALGDQDAAAEHMLMAIGFGSALGGLSAVAGKAFERLTPNFGKIAEEQAFKNLTVTTDQKAFAKADKIVGGSRGIGRMLLNQVDSEGNSLIRNMNEDYASYAERIYNSQKSIGDKLSEIYSNADKLSGYEGFDVKQLARIMEGKVVYPLKQVPGNGPVIDKVINYINDFASPRANVEGKITNKIGFKELHDWRVNLDKLIYNEGSIANLTPAKEQLRQIRTIINDQIISKGEELLPKFGKELKSQNLLYSQLKVANDTARRSALKQGANNTVSLGDYMAGGVGALAGGGVGAMAGAMANKMIKSNFNALTARASNLMPGNRGVLQAEQALKKGSDQIGSIHDIMEEGARSSSLSTLHLSAMAKFIGSKSLADKPIKDQFNALSEKLNAHDGNPEQAAENAANVVGHLNDSGAPGIAAAINQKQLAGLAALKQLMPQQTLNSSPYDSKAVQDAKSQIAPNEINKFAQRIAIINDPIRVVGQKLGAGTLTADDVNTLQNFYPKIYEQMKTQLLKNPKELNFNQKSKLDLFMQNDVAGSQLAAVPGTISGKGKQKQPDLGIVGSKTSGKNFDIKPNLAMTSVGSLLRNGTGSKRK